MNKLFLSIIGSFFKSSLGMILILNTICNPGMAINQSDDMKLSVRLMKQNGHLAFQAIIMNKTPNKLRLSYGACPLIYVVHVGSKIYTFPEKQPFVPGKTCNLSLGLATVSPKSFAIVHTSQIRSDLESALIKTKGNYSGEFRFELSTATSKQLFQLIFKRQIR